MKNIFRGHALRMVAGAIIIAVLFAGEAGATIPISSCTTISSPGEYVLEINIINSSESTCINIISNDVILDGAGNSIDGVDTGNYGVYVHDPMSALTNVTIKNLRVTDWNYGIYYETASGSIINNIADSNYYGIYLFNSSNNRLVNNTAILNTHGINLFFRSNNNVLINNTAFLNNDGIYIGYSDKNLLINNVAGRNRLNGLSGGGGITLDSSYQSILSGNIVTSNDASGISLYYSDNNILDRNIAGTNGVDGIILDTSSNNILSNNTINSNSGGIYITYFDEIGLSRNNLIYHNNIINNTRFQALDDYYFPKNQWYDPALLEGNYWSDYKGVDDGNGTGRHDLSGDHIGDTLIPHPSAKYDQYPYVYEDGWMRPSIIIYLSNKTFSPGETMSVSLRLTNPGKKTNVSADIWIDLPGGDKYWVYRNPSVTLPGGFEYTNPAWLKIIMPSIPSGTYAWHALIKNPENETISESIEPWTFSSMSSEGTKGMRSFEQTILFS
ncbi:Periplasmic copper-binding protein (NosD) [uncultured archaeon]|nr:Periplasmic copper-binding protein (NosD) [uncultured archaeon]